MGWSTADIPDQSGRTFVVTGANSGLGEQTTRALIAAGATVVMACRNLTTAQALADELGERAQVEKLDLSDLSSVRDFASRVERADVLINNAGVMAVPERRTADGFEMQMGTNHLGHFALTGLLLDKVTDRVVTLSSFMHQAGRINLEDLNWEKRRYRRWTAYGDSKMANLMFGKELAKRLEASGSSVGSMIAHPGYADTGLQGHTESFMDYFMAIGNKTPFAQSAAAGALPTLFAATAPDASSGVFYGPKRIMVGPPAVSKYNRRANNQGTRNGLWDLSAKLTGVSVA
ncbi:putative oxidoreductase [Gordonia effusa NBRC 100432]|uniref:Putative oxidoreductase n=1 Tax=Gordonia effusa NBRC 100432 TaxID=1077974 RepID=H0R2V8_9ACTN|nr:oxidoreductase [Gordonia effusa]GAB19409.1 putative oxidoreductase [Gordonia effusa NBRC 100432]